MADHEYDGGLAVTLPALSLEAVRAAAAAAAAAGDFNEDTGPLIQAYAPAPVAVPLPAAPLSTHGPATLSDAFQVPPGTPPPMPLPPPPLAPPPSAALPTTMPSLTAPSVRQSVDDAFKAVLAAQALADGHSAGSAIHRHLSRAVERLSAALELLDEDEG